MRNDFSHDSPNFAEKMNEQTMEIEMEKEQLNGKIMDREDIKHTFKTRYLNSDKVIFSEKG